MAVRVGPEKDYNWSYPGSNKDVPTVKVFRPTMEEFRDFNKYLEKIESQGSFSAGLSKIIPPKEWVPRKKGYDIDNDKKIANLKIPAPICQVVNGNRGIFQSINVQKRKMTVKEYKKMAESDRYKPPTFTDYEDLERKYWKNVTFVAPIYGADVNGSITDKSCKEWKIQNLGSILDTIDSDYNVQIAGVNTAYLYFGSWKSSFAWHTEDLDLHSINHLHFGASKFWYTIPPEYGRRFERLADGLFPQLKRECPAFLRHKMCMISPSVLRQNSIPYNKVVQQAGDIMITYPFGYHSGFNCGFNGAESTNFATPRWVEFGKRASRCYCKVDVVNISMDAFVKRFQPERYDKWLAGQDVDYHPADVKRKGPMTAAPPPSREEFLVNKMNSQEDIPDCVLNPTKKYLKRHRVHQGGRMMGGVVARVEEENCEEDTSDTNSEASDGSKDSSDMEEVRLARTDDIDDYDYEALEDIWLKAGEVDPDDVRFADDSYRGRRKARGGGACGVCEACLRLNCGQCVNCRDMVTFGGAGKLGLECERRTCTATKEEPDNFRHAETIAANNRIRGGKKGGGETKRKPIEDDEFLVKTDDSSEDDEEPEKWSPRKWNFNKRKSNQQSSKRKYKAEVAEKTKKVKVDKSVKERNLLRKKVKIKVRHGQAEMKDLVKIESDSVESASNVESELDETPKLPTTPSNPSKLLPFKKPHVDGESRAHHGTKSNDNESFESEFMQWCNEKGSAIAVNMGLPSPSKSAASPPLPKKQPSSPSKPMIRVDYDKIQSPSRSPKKYDGWITKPSTDDRSESTQRQVNLDEEMPQNGYQGSSITDAIRVACMKGKEASFGDKTERSTPAPFGGLQSTIARLMNRTNEKRSSSSSTTNLLISNGKIIQNKVNQPQLAASTLSKEKNKDNKVSNPKLQSSPTPPPGCNSSTSTSVTSKSHSRSLLKPAKLNPNLKLNESPQTDHKSDIEDVGIQKLEVLRSPHNKKVSKNSLAPSLQSPGEDQASTTGEKQTEIMIDKILKLLQAAGISSQPIGILERVDMGDVTRQQQYLSPDKSKIHLLLAQLQHAQQLRNQLSSHHQEVLELSSSTRRMSGCSTDLDPVSPNRHHNQPLASPSRHHNQPLASPSRHNQQATNTTVGRHPSQQTASPTAGQPPAANQPTNNSAQPGQWPTSRLTSTPLSPPCPRSPPGRQVQSPQQQSYSSLRLLLTNLSLHALRSLEHQLLLLVGSSSSLTNSSSLTSSSNQPTSSQTLSSASSSLSQTQTLEASRSYSTHPSATRISQTPPSHQRNLQSSSQIPPKKQLYSSNELAEPWTARLAGPSQTSSSKVKAGAFDVRQEQRIQLGLKLDTGNTIKPRRVE